MLRLLFWIVVIFAAIWLWRKFKAPAASNQSHRPTREQDARADGALCPLRRASAA
jgi:uncharacterized protein